MVSVTVEVVVVFEVIEPCVKLGTTGTDIALFTFARTSTTATRARFFVFMSHQSMTVISLTNCPIAEDPAPPAVTVTVPALVTVPAKEPADPAAQDV